MTATLLGARHAVAAFRVFAGRFPASPDEHDAYVVTGSPAGVHDDLPWIEPLAGFLRAARGRAKLVGICFGHQVMAHAFGGTVARAPQGWGVGLHRYDLVGDTPGLGAGSAAVIASHQDQVTAPPPGAAVVGGSGFTPHGLLAYRDQPAISMQCHPEFTADFARALTAAQAAPDLGDDTRAAALASLDRPNDNPRLAAWIADFLDR